MKIAIHNGGGFAERWISYCKANNIEFKLVNAYDTDIVSQLADCNAFMWHFSHLNYKDMLFAKSLLYSLAQRDLKVFPDYNTAWHFDDKVGQKYLLEAVSAPIVKTYVFYTKTDALNWIKSINFPKVFKLKGGAGSTNVKLINNAVHAKNIIKKAFGNGFLYYDPKVYFVDILKKHRNGKANLIDVLKSFVRLFYKSNFLRMFSREKGYVYFQDFIPNNEFDIRVVVINNKAFALKRLIRTNDFRASGSGKIIYNKNEIDNRCIQIAFEVNRKIKMQSAAFDFVFDQAGNPLIVEVSYGYSTSAYDNCQGYWTDDMIWHEGTNFDFCGWMVDSLINAHNENDK